MAYLGAGPGESAGRLEKWKSFQQQILTPFVRHQ